MGIFSTKNKNNERNVNFAAGNEFGAITQNTAINATLKDDCIFIVSRMNKKMSVSLKYEKITNCEYVTEKDIQEKSKSVLGRAAIGNLLLGPVGAVVGGMSGLNGTKKKTKIRNFIIINYTSNNDEGVIYLEIVPATLNWKTFLSELKAKANIQDIEPKKKEMSVEL